MKLYVHFNISWQLMTDNNSVWQQLYLCNLCYFMESIVSFTVKIWTTTHLCKEGYIFFSLNQYHDICYFSEPSSPRNLWVEEVKRKSITLCWDIPADMEEVSYSFITTYSCNGDEKEKDTKNNRIVLSDLEPDTKYTFSVTTVTKHGSRSTRKTLDEWTRKLIYNLTF